MFDKNNFMGSNGFVWFVGEVEDRIDPLGLGRVRVRIFGRHTDDKALLPTEDLPWAQSLFSMNVSKIWQPPSIGDWVVGFFFDGESAQFPVVMGILPGLKE